MQHGSDMTWKRKKNKSYVIIMKSKAKGMNENGIFREKMHKDHYIKRTEINIII